MDSNFDRSIEFCESQRKEFEQICFTDKCTFFLLNGHVYKKKFYTGGMKYTTFSAVFSAMLLFDLYSFKKNLTLELYLNILQGVIDSFIMTYLKIQMIGNMIFLLNDGHGDKT